MVGEALTLYCLHVCCLSTSDETIFDVKFYPYGTEDDEQIFAFTGYTDVSVLTSMVSMRISSDVRRLSYVVLSAGLIRRLRY